MSQLSDPKNASLSFLFWRFRDGCYLLEVQVISQCFCAVLIILGEWKSEGAIYQFAWQIKSVLMTHPYLCSVFQIKSGDRCSHFLKIFFNFWTDADLAMTRSTRTWGKKNPNTRVKLQRRKHINEICVDNLSGVMQHGASASKTKRENPEKPKNRRTEFSRSNQEI